MKLASQELPSGQVMIALGLGCTIVFGFLSVVAPFRYIRIVFAVLLGIFFLGETIDTYTIVGSAITILAGIYIWVRENRIAAKTTEQP